MNELPTRDELAANLDSNFVMHLADGTTRTIKLAKVSDLVSRPPQEQFSVIFQVPSDTPAEQAIYKLVHKELGTIELFLVPVSRNDESTEFQAVFNRLVQ